MLIGAIDALSGGLHMYFLMSELTKHAHHIMNFEVPPLVHTLKSTYVDH